MAVLSMMRFEGDPDEIAARMRANLEPVAARLAEKHGGLATMIVRTDGGVLALNLWETEEGRHAMAEEPEIQAAVRAAGLPEPRFEGHEVLYLNVTDRLRSTAMA